MVELSLLLVSYLPLCIKCFTFQDQNSPDVYETSDLPESDQNQFAEVWTVIWELPMVSDSKTQYFIGIYIF